MNIRIQTLQLTNFKCFRQKEFEFKEDIVTIRGRNGVGKTTIFDAILFCLFGKNSQDQTKFNIKTTDDQGDIIPHLDHSVELTLLVDCLKGDFDSGAIGPHTISLKHSVKEKWNKKRGSIEEVFAGDTHEYFVNGELYTAQDYKKYIASLIDEQTFRILTNPQYFTALKWQDQREILTRMVGNIEPEVIANTEELAALMRSLQADGEDIIAYKKHLGYQIKKIKEALDKIPVRMEEQNKALPEKLDWADIQTSLNNKQTILKGIESDILNLKQGNGSDLKRKELNNQISETTASIDKLRYEAESKARELAGEKAKKVNEQSLKFSEALNNQRLMEQTIEGDNRLIARCEEVIKDSDAELEQLRGEWPTRKFEWSEDMSVCPTCGQILPQELLQEKKRTMLENFNRNLEAAKQSLRDKAKKLKDNVEEVKKELKSLNEKLTSDTEALAKMKEEINVIHSEKAKIEKEPTATADELLSENGKYVKLLSQLHELQDALESVTDSEDNREKLAELEANKAQYEAEIANYQTQLASKAQYDKIQKLIEGIEEEQKDLVRQLSELEKQEDIARQYEDRQNAILEERVNQHFKITSWKMFRTVVNNGDPYNEPYCECYDLNGTAYHDGLNQASRLNIGLDIINCMSKIYNVSAPVIIDQSESTLDIFPTTGQQLRLQVYDSELSIA